MGICQSTPVRDVTAPEATTEASSGKGAAPRRDVVDEVPLTADAVQISEKAVAKPAPTIPDSYYESLGLVKTGPVSWVTATPKAEVQAETPSRWQNVKASLPYVVPSKDGVVGGTALWLWGQLSFRGQGGGAKVETFCHTCTFRHWTIATECPRCGTSSK